MPTHMAVHECFFVHMHVKAQLAPPCPSRSKGKLKVVVLALLALISPIGPVGRLKKKRKNKTYRGESGREKEEDMKGDLWALLTKGLPLHKPMASDYKTKLLDKRALFSHSCVVGLQWRGADIKDRCLIGSFYSS